MARRRLTYQTKKDFGKNEEEPLLSLNEAERCRKPIQSRKKENSKAYGPGTEEERASLLEAADDDDSNDEEL